MQRKASNPEQCVKHVRHVTQPVRDSSTLGVLIDHFIPETKKEKDGVGASVHAPELRG